MITHRIFTFITLLSFLFAKQLNDGALFENECGNFTILPHPEQNMSAVSPDGLFEVVSKGVNGPIILKNLSNNQETILHEATNNTDFAESFKKENWGAGSGSQQRVLWTSNGKYLIVAQPDLFTLIYDTDTYKEISLDIFDQFKGIYGDYIRLSSNNDYLILYDPEAFKGGPQMAILDLNKRTSKVIGGCFYMGTVPRENKRTGKIFYNLGNTECADTEFGKGVLQWPTSWLDNYKSLTANYKNGLSSYDFYLGDNNKKLYIKVREKNYIVYDIKTHTVSGCHLE